MNPAAMKRLEDLERALADLRTSLEQEEPDEGEDMDSMAGLDDMDADAEAQLDAAIAEDEDGIATKPKRKPRPPAVVKQDDEESYIEA